jgi:SAM-dependent methyltransferase
MALAYSRTVADVASLGTGFDIIEFGCFTGIVAASLQQLGNHVIASDIDFVVSDPGNQEFLRSLGVAVVPHDLANTPLPFASNLFDLIIFTEVLEHLNFNPLPLLAEFHRILKPAGLVYLATPNLARISNRINMVRGRSFMNPVEHLYWNLSPDTGMSVGLHWREGAKDELIELLSGSGFSLQSHYYTLLSANRSRFPRRQLISLMYSLFPSLLPTQVGVFMKN